MMRVRWIGLMAVAVIASVIIGYKAHLYSQHAAAIQAALPRVLLVADMTEADAPGDNCAQIIHLVRAARDRGVRVQELEPDSKSDLLTSYRVLTVPTVLILDRDGGVVSRFEGEGNETVQAVRAGLDQLRVDDK